jgi:hypothetical protein
LPKKKASKKRSKSSQPKVVNNEKIVMVLAYFFFLEVLAIVTKVAVDTAVGTAVAFLRSFCDF